MARSHLEGVKRQQMQQYITRHLARGALIVAANQKAVTVTAEHVRLAATALR